MSLLWRSSSSGADSDLLAERAVAAMTPLAVGLSTRRHLAACSRHPDRFALARSHDLHVFFMPRRRSTRGAERLRGRLGQPPHIPSSSQGAAIGKSPLPRPLRPLHAGSRACRRLGVAVVLACGLSRWRASRGPARRWQLGHSRDRRSAATRRDRRRLVAAPRSGNSAPRSPSPLRRRREQSSPPLLAGSASSPRRRSEDDGDAEPAGTRESQAWSARRCRGHARLAIARP